MLFGFIKSESGATLVEYGVALLVAISVGGMALVALGNQVDANMMAACATLNSGGEVDGNC